jgi:hypothetical protein
MGTPGNTDPARDLYLNKSGTVSSTSNGEKDMIEATRTAFDFEGAVPSMWAGY